VVRFPLFSMCFEVHEVQRRFMEVPEVQWRFSGGSRRFSGGSWRFTEVQRRFMEVPGGSMEVQRRFMEVHGGS
jgi:hypothetical protein